jgi:hypothetical protein
VKLPKSRKKENTEKEREVEGKKRKKESTKENSRERWWTDQRANQTAKCLKEGKQKEKNPTSSGTVEFQS